MSIRFCILFEFGIGGFSFLKRNCLELTYVWVSKLYTSDFKNWEFGKVGAWIFQQAIRPALKQALLTNRAAETREGSVNLRSAKQVKSPWARTGLRDGWKSRDANTAENRFLN